MIAIRRSTTSEENPELRAEPARDGESNAAWLRRVGATGGIVLVGGASLTHFRMRVAQSHLRQDLYPSLWSVAAILHDDGERLDTVSLSFGRHASSVPRTNAVQTRTIGDYDDTRRYPNVAWLRFSQDGDAIRAAVDRVTSDRSIVDLPRLLLAWLGFAWGAGQRGNPLLEGVGIPSASFVEAVYALSGIELTPSLSADASCPEAIWQSAKWWRDYYEKTRSASPAGIARVPEGRFAIRQPEAAITSNGDVRRS
jgi:hypothetical protein